MLKIARSGGRTMGRALVVVLMTLVAGGCNEGTPDSSRQLGDTTFVFSSSPLRGPASLREVSRIGMIDGPPEYLFGRFPMFTVGPDGSLFVADGELRHYDADGAYVRTIARRGAGPGEVRAVASMDISADGLLAVLDFGTRRVSVFSLDGNLVREIRLLSSAGRPGYGRDAIQWDDQGQLWIALNPPRTGPDTLGARQRPLFGRLIAHEEVTDTVFPANSSLGGLRAATAGILRRGVRGQSPPRHALRAMDAESNGRIGFRVLGQVRDRPRSVGRRSDADLERMGATGEDGRGA